jgi:hypothetical protein
MLALSRRSAIAAAAFSLVLAVLASGTASATHPRPRGATPLFDSLAIDYQPCGPNTPTVHGGPATSPLAGKPSCPPAKESPFLTVGTPDTNGVAAQFVGSVRQTVVTTPSPSDIKLVGDMTDIRCEPPIAGNPTLCVPNGPGPPAYQGETEVIFPIDVTDHCNYAGGPGPCPAPPTDGTVASTIVLRFTMPCAVPATPGIGGHCSIATSWNAVYPGIVPPPSPPANGSRMNIEVGVVHVSDGGADGKVSTNDNRPFAIRGLFSP